MKKFILFLLFIMIFLLPKIYAVCEEGQININTASLEKLDEIYGIGPAKAQAIIDSRPYETIDDLIGAYGIGETTLKNIKSQNIACVEGEKEEIIENVPSPPKEILEENVNKVDTIKTNPENQIVELKVITLNTKGEKEKDIKTDNVSEFKEKENRYAVYGFVAFSILLAFLFGIKALKNKYKYKNEFDEQINQNG